MVAILGGLLMLGLGLGIVKDAHLNPYIIRRLR